MEIKLSKQLFRIVTCCFVIGLFCSALFAETPADLLITNARVYTVNSKQPWAEAIAIHGDKIVAVGSRKELQKFQGASTKTIDAGGRLVLPGFTDCHVHFMSGSLGLTHVDLNGANTV